MEDDAKAFMRALMVEFVGEIRDSIGAISTKLDATIAPQPIQIGMPKATIVTSASSVTPISSSASPDASWVVATNTTVPTAPTHTRCLAEGPSPGATKSTHALTSAAAPTAPPTTVNAILVDVASSTVVAEVATPTAPSSTNVTTMALLQEAVSETAVPAAHHGLESLEVVPSVCTSDITIVPTTCSTYCLSKHSRAVGSLDEPVGASSSRRISSMVSVHLPLPRPSFIADHAAGGEARPLPWLVFREIVAMVSAEITADKENSGRVPPHPPDKWSLFPGAWSCSQAEVSITVQLAGKTVRLCNDGEEVNVYMLSDEVQRHDELEWQPWPPPWRVWITPEWHMIRPRPFSSFECNQEGVPSISPMVQLLFSPSSKPKLCGHSPGNKYRVSVNLLAHQYSLALFLWELAWQLQGDFLAVGAAVPFSVVEHLVGATELNLLIELWVSRFIIKYFHWHATWALSISVTSKYRSCIIPLVSHPSEEPLCILLSPGHQYLSENWGLLWPIELWKHLFDTAAGHVQHRMLQPDRADMYWLITQHGKVLPLFLQTNPPWSSLTQVDTEVEEAGVLHLLGNLSSFVTCLIAKDQCNARVKIYLSILFLRAEEWTPDIQCVQHACMISYAPLWHERLTKESPLQILVNGSVMALFSSCSPCSFDSQITGFLVANDSRTLEQLRVAAPYSTTWAMGLLHISAHRNSMKQAFQISGALIQLSWWVLNTWSLIVLMRYAYWLFLEHVYMGVDVLEILLLGWSDIAILSGCNTWVSEPEFSEFQQLNLCKRLLIRAVSTRLRVNPMKMLTGEAAQIRCGCAEFKCIIIRRSNYLNYSTRCQEGAYFKVGHLSYHVVQCNLPEASHCAGEDHALGSFLKQEHGGVAFSSSFPFSRNMLPRCTNMQMAKSRGSGELFQWLANDLLGECFPYNIYGSVIASINRHSQTSKAVLQFATTLIFWLSVGVNGEANQHRRVSWDPGGCMFELGNCEKWWTTSELTPLHCSDQLRWSSVLLACVSIIWLVAWAVDDLEFSTGYGKDHSQEGRYALIRATFSNLVNVFHDFYLDKIDIDHGYDQEPFQGGKIDKAVTLFFEQVSFTHKYYLNLKEVHAPWDPGKSALQHPSKALAWGQADFQGGGIVRNLPYRYLDMGLSLGSVPGPLAHPATSRNRRLQIYRSRQ